MTYLSERQAEQLKARLADLPRLAAAIVAVRAEREGLPHWRDLAARLIAARDAMGEPEPQEEQ